MSPDNFQQAWQAQSSQTRVTVDTDWLVTEVQRNQRQFQAMIFCRDLREVVVAFLMIPVWFFLGAWSSSPWTWYLEVPALIWVIGYFLVDRLRHKQKPSEKAEPLLTSVKESLTQVEHQIWLLRNVLWWYLLPLGVPMLVFSAHITWLASSHWWEALAAGTLLFVFLLAVFSFIYYLNQRAVDAQLEPRRQELLALLASLDDESTSIDRPDRHHHYETGESAVMKSAASVDRPRTLGRTIAVMVLLTAITTLASVAAYFVGRAAAEYPRLSPFAAVRWQQSQPEVQLGDEWFKLVSLNGLPAAEIVAFSQQTYGNLWRKRFEEDLVELLTRMGHPPQDTVTLVVQSLTSSETRTLEDVPMTRANRRAIREAAQARERSEQQQGKRRAVPIEDAELPDPHRQVPQRRPDEGRFQWGPANYGQLPLAFFRNATKSASSWMVSASSSPAGITETVPG